MSNPTDSIVIQIPRIPTEIMSEFCTSDNLWVRSCNPNLSLLDKLAKKIPSEYGWRFRNVEAFKAEFEDIAKAAQDALPINQLIWFDHLGNCEAYSLMNTWRSVELARSCVWAISRGELVAAALLARSSLETSAQFAATSREICATIAGANEEESKGRLLDPSIDFRKQIVNSNDLEMLLLKTVFACRTPGTEEFYKPKNIVTVIQQTSKIVGQELLLGMYEQLCEVAHPNLLGRSIYLLDQRPGKRMGDETRIIGLGLGPSARKIKETTLGAISWGAVTNVSAFRLMSQTIETVYKRLKTA